MQIYRFLKKNIPATVACILLSGFVVLWYGFLNPYICLFYREQSQLFLFDSDYFLQYLRMPGGLTAYLASFLIQFFRFRWLGTLIYLCFFWCFYVVSKTTWKKFAVFNRSFFMAFIPGLLFLPTSINMLFDPADELSVLLALFGFIMLTKLPENKYYFFLIPLSVTVFFILIGGNVLLSLALFVFYSFKGGKGEKGGKGGKGEKYVAIGLLSLLVPVVVWYFFYLVSFKTACFSLTPFRYPDSALFDARSIAWLSVIVLPFIGLPLKNIRLGEKWIFILNTGLAVILLSLIVKQQKPDFENIVKMGFDAGNHRWEDIIETRKKTSVSHLSCYYTNLALQQTGQMAEKMFHYDQIGVSGLFVDLKDHFSCYAGSELFYQWGWINPAQHLVYESMSGYTFIKEANVRNMKRLYDCAFIQQNSSLAKKYGKVLSKSLFYRDYAKRGEEVALTMKNSLIRNMPEALESVLEDIMPVVPQTVPADNAMLEALETVLENMPEALERTLEENNTLQAVFEYLMAWYLLERDYEQAKKCFDRYFHYFSYPQIPAHYAEFLLLYKRINQLDDSFYEQYPISRDLRERFDMMDTLVQANMDDMIRKTLEDGFKHTYWFYVKFPLVQVQTTSKDEKYIY